MDMSGAMKISGLAVQIVMLNRVGSQAAKMPICITHLGLGPDVTDPRLRYVQKVHMGPDDFVFTYLRCDDMGRELNCLSIRPYGVVYCHPSAVALARHFLIPGLGLSSERTVFLLRSLDEFQEVCRERYA